jgi:hypothetical protein
MVLQYIYHVCVSYTNLDTWAVWTRGHLQCLQLHSDLVDFVRYMEYAFSDPLHDILCRLGVNSHHHRDTNYLYDHLPDHGDVFSEWHSHDISQYGFLTTAAM